MRSRAHRRLDSLLSRCRRGGREEGQALLEIALAMPLLLLLITTILQFGLMYSRYETLVNAADSGARYLSLGVSGKASNICDLAVTQTIRSTDGDLTLPASDVTPSFPGSATNADYCGSNSTTGVACTPYVYGGSLAPSGSGSCNTNGKETSGDEAAITISYPYVLTILGMHIMHVNLSTTAAQAIE